MFDAHVHVDFLSESAQRVFAVACVTDGVTACAIAGVTLDGTPRITRAQNLMTEAGLKCVVGAGIHPEHLPCSWEQLANELSESRLQSYFEKTLRPKFEDADFVGETGLDKRVSSLVQSLIFDIHVQLAVEFDKPLVLHVVGRHEDALRTLKAHVRNTKKTRGLVHSFIGSSVIAQRYVELGFVIGASMRALRSPRTMDAISQVGLDQVTLETDEVTAIPPRSDAPLLAEALAKHFRVDTAKIAEKTSNTAQRVFRLDKTE